MRTAEDTAEWSSLSIVGPGWNSTVLTPNKKFGQQLQVTVTYIHCLVPHPSIHTCVLPSNFSFSLVVQWARPATLVAGGRYLKGSNLRTSTDLTLPREGHSSQGTLALLFHPLPHLPFQIHHKPTQWHLDVCNGLCSVQMLGHQMCEDQILP